MKRWISLAVLVGLALAASFIWGRVTGQHGIPRDQVHALLREAGDSAVTAFKSGSEMADFVADALEDTLEHYEAEVRAAARIVIERDTIVQLDTVRVTQAIARVVGDTAMIALPELNEDGVALAETLTVAPPPSLLLRAAHLTFEPDTIIAALLQTPEGIERFSAAALRTGRFVRIADAAQLRPREHKMLNNVLRAVTIGGCFLAGIGVAQENTALTAGGGSACLGGFSIELLRFP